MKTGVVQLAAVYVNCPHCGESFEGSDDGSMLLSMHNMNPERIGEVVTCWACAQQYKLPAGIRRVFPK